MKWIRVTNQSLSVAVRNAGFDLSVYNQYHKETQEMLRRRSCKEALRMIEDEYQRLSKGRSKGGELSEIKNGCYIICVSNPFTISYNLKASKVVYIGRGNICTQIKGHYNRSLFDFMQCLAGTNFDFYFCEPKRKNAPKFYMQVEYYLLEEFKKSIGGVEYPLLNKNKGNEQKNLSPPSKDWNKPLKNTGVKPLWKLEFQRDDFRNYLLG